MADPGRNTQSDGAAAPAPGAGSPAVAPGPATKPAVAQPAVEWADLAREMWTYLTGQGGAINYQFVDMQVEVPQSIRPAAPKVTWRINGTLRITTTDRDSSGR